MLTVIKKREGKTFKFNAESFRRKGYKVDYILEYIDYIVNNIDINKVENKRINITL